MDSGLAFYLRLSLADGDLGKDNKDESNSIENQRLLLQSFVDVNDELAGEVTEYIDDGYTGTNFNRPAFQRLIEDAKRGKIKTILVKDLSRLGRDYIGVGDYLEQIFPVLGVRFIAVNSNYDSNKYEGRTMGLDMAVSNLVNTLYSRDISKKIKSAYRTKWKQGVGTPGRPPYGYVRDEKARGGWRIDEDAARVVKYIFDKAAEGWTTRMIADGLNEEKEDTPSVHRQKQQLYGGTRKIPDTECHWDVGMVRVILHRYEYTGAFVHNKRESIQVGSLVTRAVPDSKQFVIEDGHDAIVSVDTYHAAQDAIQFKSKAQFKMDTEYPLRGKIRCGVCTLLLTHLELAYGAVYFCPHKKKVGNHAECCEEYMPAKNIDHAVLRLLQTKLKLLIELGQTLEKGKGADSHSIHSQLKKEDREIDRLKAERVRQYEAYAEGIVDREFYLKKKRELTQEIEVHEQTVLRLSTLIEQDTVFDKKKNYYGEKAYMCMGTEKLTREIADTFIETVYVYDEKTIEVEFKFDDLLRQLADKCA